MDNLLYLKYIAALIFVLGLIGLAAIALRRTGWAGPLTSPDNQRLKIKAMKMVDSRRRLILIERDNQEHLLLLAPEGSLVIESNITPPPSPPAS
ncbi:MAG: hypothetical protein AB7G80_04250 [Dongiaceae bacterium]